MRPSQVELIRLQHIAFLGDMEQRAFISLLHVELIVIIHHQLIR